MSEQIIKNFEEYVELNFQLYSSLFLTIPMDNVVQTGLLIPILRDTCEKGLTENKDPISIIDEFLHKNRPNLTPRQKIDFLFHVIQYVEREILLVDALEDAAYNKIHRIDSPSTLKQLIQRVKDDHLEWKMKHFLTTFGIRVVLTAHPTQFYPGKVLAISADLSKAIAAKETATVRDLMHQLSKTPFFRKQKPTPLNEAVRLTWYLVNIFYPATGELIESFGQVYREQLESNTQIISLGFWPGGDRDGNPFVTVNTTLEVARLLRKSIITCYIDEIAALKRRLSFVGVFDKLEEIEAQLQLELNHDEDRSLMQLEVLKSRLKEIEQIIIEKHHSLFISQFQQFTRKIELFGYHFASLDIRQDSRIIGKAFDEIVENNQDLFSEDFKNMDLNHQLSFLINLRPSFKEYTLKEELSQDTLSSMAAVKNIQQRNGERGSNRYIISNCRGALDMGKVMALFRFSGWNEHHLPIDIVPLFETIDDLHKAGESVHSLYQNPAYRKHLEARGCKQTIMLGFSDGTKDGGYLMANWSIYTAKEQITSVSRQAGIEVIFFDGRGGPPARGGGNTHHFYAALGNRIESKQLQLTLQGQTISSHYGIRDAAVHNLGYLLAAGLSNNVYNDPSRNLTDEHRMLMDEMADTSYRKYDEFKKHPLFIPFLEERSTLKYYGMANISSRPSKRNDNDKLVLEDLRAIPFVGAWSQLKQNVPGFFGLGSALKEQEEKGKLQQCIEFYKQSGFFRALISNSMQSISKSNFSLTRYMAEDEKYGAFWNEIKDEFILTREMLLKVSGMLVLLEDNARSRKSIQLRERVVLPLLVIQQYALLKIQNAGKTNEEETGIYEKLVMRSLFGNINASRNAV